MNLFYNKNGVGDVAFLQLDPAQGEFEYKQYGDVVRITQENDVVATIFLTPQIIYL